MLSEGVGRSGENLPIKMLNDRVLVDMGGPEGERRSTGGILIPATAQIGVLHDCTGLPSTSTVQAPQ